MLIDAVCQCDGNHSHYILRTITFRPSNNYTDRSLHELSPLTQQVCRGGYLEWIKLWANLDVAMKQN